MNNELIVIESPKSPEAEMFKNLRTNIQFMSTNSEKKVILMTSTIPGEGKSYVTSNLGAAFAQLNKKVLIVDVDLRKGRQYSIFGAHPRPGISNYLSGVVDQDFIGNKDEIENYIQPTFVDNLYLISSGSVPPNPSELLISTKMYNLIENLKKKFDIILFDAPPTLIVTDALVLTRVVDFTIIVSAQNVTKIEDLQKAKQSIENVGGKIAGVVLNKVQLTGKTYEKSYYYGRKSYVTGGKKPKKRTR